MGEIYMNGWIIVIFLGFLWLRPSQSLVSSRKLSSTG